jgi:hypothetical protein
VPQARPMPIRVQSSIHAFLARLGGGIAATTETA